jgi:hypothetical protein
MNSSERSSTKPADPQRPERESEDWRRKRGRKLAEV